MKIILRQSGMSLLEVLLAMGLIGAVSVAGMNLFKQQSMSQKTVEKNFEVANELELIRGILAKPINCRQTFLNQNPASGTVNAIQKIRLDAINFDQMYVKNSSLPSGIKVTGYALDKTASNLASDESNLKVFFSRGKGTIKEDTIKFIKIIYTLNAGGTIDTCFAVTSREEIWKRSIVDPTDIFYTGGQVGIGIDSPTQSLHVVGNTLLNGPSRTVGLLQASANLANSAGPAIQIGNDVTISDVDQPGTMGVQDVSNPATGSIRLGSSATISGNGGNIGVGTTNPQQALDINGSVKLGAPGTCDASTKGSMGYDNASDKVMFCVGNPPAWTALSLGGAGQCRFCRSCGGDYPHFGGARKATGDWGPFDSWGWGCSGGYYAEWSAVQLCCK